MREIAFLLLYIRFSRAFSSKFDVVVWIPFANRLARLDNAYALGTPFSPPRLMVRAFRSIFPTFYPRRSLLGAHGFHIGDEGDAAQGLGRPAGGDVDVGAGGGRRGWNQYQGGHHHLGGQMSAQHWGGGGGGRGKNNGGVVDDNVADAAAGGGGGRHYMWREEQIEQFVYLIRSGEEKRRWIMNDYEFEDVRDSTMAIAAAVADNNDNGGGGGGGGGGGETSSTLRWSRELERRLIDFEVRSRSLVREMYRREGWMHSADHGERRAGNDDDDDGFFSDSDSEEDDDAR